MSRLPLPRDIWTAVADLGKRLDRVALTLIAEDWHPVDGTDEPGFETSWVNFGAGNEDIHFRKDGLGNVEMKGLAKNGTIPGRIFTLPPGYRPLKNRHIPVASNSALGVIIVTPEGYVHVLAGSNAWVDVTAVRFRAEQ